jgi:hypothetical protein
MQVEFIPYEQALELKELGFDEPCLKYWNGIGEYFDQKDWFNWNQAEKFVSIPLYQQAFRWFRLEHDIDYSILPTSTSGHRLSTRTFNIVIYRYYMNMNVQTEILRIDGEIAEYVNKEEAELDCLNKLIELAKIKL